MRRSCGSETERTRQQFIRSMPGLRVVRPCHDHELIELQPLRELRQAAGNRLAGADHRLVPQRLDRRTLRLRVRVLGGVVRRDQWLAKALLEPDTPEFARLQKAARLRFGIGGQRPDADRRLRRRVAGARTIVAPVKRERFLDAASLAEEIRERVREPEMRGELRAVIRASQDPQLRARRARSDAP